MIIGKRMNVRTWAMATAVVAAISSPAFAQTTRPFDIPAQPLSSALEAFGSQSGGEILFDRAQTAGKSAPAVRGAMAPSEALRRLLVGSALSMRQVNATTFVVAPSPQGQGAEGPATEIGEIVVTGTRIRGAAPTSPVHVVTREDIDRSGYTQVGDVIRSLPENFGGGQNPGVIGGGSANQNISNSSTVNLRGLGSDATLVLLNGRRLAADNFGQAPDISGIPLAAIQRVEVMTDGASAIYGSDAVAGVTNFILRRDFEGLEVGARAGVATHGGGFEQGYSVLTGAAGEMGSILVNLDSTEKDAVLASDRDFTSAASPITSLLRPYERFSALVSGAVDITDRASLSLDALWSRQTVDYQWQPQLAGATSRISTDTPTYSVSAGLDVRLAADWGLRVTAGDAGNDTDQSTIYATSASSLSYENEVQYGELAFEGPLLRLPGGDLRVAVGGGARDEDFRTAYGDVTDTEGSRTVQYLFAEALAPLAPPSDRPGLNALELSVSARMEDYSDFGSTTTPKVGLRYVPTPGLAMRATWGESFKAPPLAQVHMARYVLLFPEASLGADGGGSAFFVTGGNPDLRPERSTSWTLGAEYSPPALQMTLGVNYFNIDYSDRVLSPIANLSAALTDPMYVPFIQSAPTPAQQAELIASSPNFYNYTGAAYDPASVTAIAYNLYANVAAQSVEGVDLSYRQTFATPAGPLDAFANATWIDLRQQNVPTAAQYALSGTIFNIPELRARAGASWDVAGFTLTGIANYQAGSTDTGVTPHRDIGSWLTFDTTVSYATAAGSSAWSGLSIVLSATNLFDRDPPYAASPSIQYQGVYYDATNASAMGRFVSLSVRKRF
jgi:iron complex outermembrane receptor protein